jgi:hypothetical protein
MRSFIPLIRNVEVNPPHENGGISIFHYCNLRFHKAHYRLNSSGGICTHGHLFLSYHDRGNFHYRENFKVSEKKAL